MEFAVPTVKVPQTVRRRIQMVSQRWIARLAVLLALPVSLQADTLYLRNGTRVQGELLGIRNGQIEFEERRTFGSSRTLRFDRGEIDRIEFENNYGNSNSNNSNSNSNSNNGFGGR